MPTILTLTAEKKHSVRYDHDGKDFKMSIYVPKAHPVFKDLVKSEIDPWPQSLNMELTRGE